MYADHKNGDDVILMLISLHLKVRIFVNLLTVINNLSALKHLAIETNYFPAQFGLSILSQLMQFSTNCHFVHSLVPSLNRYAAKF